MAKKYVCDMSNIPTEALIEELKSRKDTLLCVVYDRQTVQDRLWNLGCAEADNDEFIDAIIADVDKDELADKFRKWENEEYSAYDCLTDTINSHLEDF